MSTTKDAATLFIQSFGFVIRTTSGKEYSGTVPLNAPAAIFNRTIRALTTSDGIVINPITNYTIATITDGKITWH